METSNCSLEQESRKAAEEYGAILNFNSSSTSDPRVNDVDASIEAVLTRLDEFYGMLDMIRSDTTKVSDDMLHIFRAERDKLKLVYAQIDDLEKFVEVVKSDCDATERCLKEAETEFGALSTIKKALSVIKLPSLWKKTETRRPAEPAKPHFTPPSIFHTRDYIPPGAEQAEKE